MASRASEPPPGRSVTAGIIIIGDEILKVGLGRRGGRARRSPVLKSLLHILLGAGRGEGTCCNGFLEGTRYGGGKVTLTLPVTHLKNVWQSLYNLPSSLADALRK